MKKPVPKPNIVELFEHYGARVIGPDRGGWRKAECPLHDDRTPSASVNEEECRWRCFTCDEGGDAVDLIMRMEHELGFAAAVSRAQALVDGDGGAVREERGRTSLLPPRPGHRPGRRRWTPPWKGL